MLKVNDFHSSNCHFPCPLPKKTSSSSTDSCRGGHLDQKTGGRTLVRKGAGSFVGFFKCRKYFAERCWWCFTYVPKVEVILVRTLDSMMCFKCVWFINRDVCCVLCDPGKQTLSDRSKTCAMSHSIVWKVGACHWSCISVDSRSGEVYHFQNWQQVNKWPMCLRSSFSGDPSSWLTFHNL